MRFAILAAFSTTIVLAAVPAAKRAAFRMGLVALPRRDRWHSSSTPLFGGAAIFFGYLVMMFLTHSIAANWGIVAGSIVVFAIGWIDDVFHLRPFHKVLGIVVATGFVLRSGLYLPWFNSVYLNLLVTIVWLIGITNAINLLDNMDGLAAGISAIAAFFLAASFAVAHQADLVLVAGILGGTILGFLLYNFPPASIFMGDCGSLWLGFCLGSLTLASNFGRSRNLLYVLAGPVVLLLIPIFDTTFVTLTRIVSGRSISQGGRDHTSHRLALVMGSERNALVILYAFAILSGLLSLLVRLGYSTVSFALIPTFLLLLIFVGVYLGQVKVPVTEARDKLRKLHTILGIAIRNGIFMIVLDAILIALSYYSALLLRFDGNIPSSDLHLFLESISWFVMIKIAVFVAVGVYRDIWNYFSIQSAILYSKACFLGGALCALAVLFTRRFNGFSRAAIIMDAILLFLLMAFSRLSFRILDVSLRRTAAGNASLPKALIYGAGELSALLVKHLENNAAAFGYLPVGFIDDDPSRRDRTLCGYRVFSTEDGLKRIVETDSIDAVLVAALDSQESHLNEIRKLCQQVQIPVKQLSIQFQ